MIRTTVLAAALAALAPCLSACSKGSAPAPAGEPAEPQPGVAPAPGLPAPAYVSAVTALRREPSDAQRVKGPGKKVLSNTLAVLLRGEKVTLLEVKDDWARTRSSDDREGWLRRSALLEGEGITEATVLAPADVFDRPDLLAANAKRKVDPGTLLLVVKTKPPFSEVSVSSGPNAWVLTERLATGEKEVSVAKLAEKARWLKRSGKEDEAKQILALAREHFAGVPLVDALAIELEEAPPGGEVPASTTGSPPSPNP
jgi:SH3-like domain-containing protein